MKPVFLIIAKWEQIKTDETFNRALTPDIFISKTGTISKEEYNKSFKICSKKQNFDRKKLNCK